MMTETVGHRFRSVIQAAVEKAVLAERERCASLCFKRMPEKGMERAHTDPGIAYELGRIDQAQSDAAAIRAGTASPPPS